MCLASQRTFLVFISRYSSRIFRFIVNLFHFYPKSLNYGKNDKLVWQNLSVYPHLSRTKLVFYIAFFLLGAYIQTLAYFDFYYVVFIIELSCIVYNFNFIIVKLLKCLSNQSCKCHWMLLAFQMLYGYFNPRFILGYSAREFIFQRFIPVLVLKNLFI